MTPLELEDIGAELRQGRPAPTRDFAAELDAWAAEGFPRRPEQRPARPPRIRWRRWLVPAIGFAGAAALVIGVAVTQTNSGGPASTDNGSAVIQPDAGHGASSDVPRPQSPTTSGAAESAPPNGASGDFRASAPIQERSADVTLSTDSDNVARVAQDASDVTENFNGVVDAMSVRTDAGGKARAELQLRIPVQNLNAALGELSDLAHVESRDEALLDITKAYGSAGKEFNNAQARVSELVAALAATSDPAEIAGLKAQLQVARHRLSAAKAQLRDVKQRGNLSRVRLSVISKDSSSTLANAADDALNVLDAIAGAMLIALAVLIPLAALVAAAWFGSKGLRRRHRERVLDRE